MTIDSPVFTRVYDHIEEMLVRDDSLYITGVSSEERSRHGDFLKERRSDLTFAYVSEVENGRIHAKFNGRDLSC